MNVYVQLKSFIISYIYGIIIYNIIKYYFNINFKCNKYIKSFITIIFTLDIFIIYTCILYKINGGYLHLYFILIFILGIINGKPISKISVKYKKRT